MAYISTINDDWHAEAFRRGNAYQIVVNVGYDDALGQTYSIVAGLDVAAGGGLEYYFYIMVADERNGTETACHCGLESANILPKVQRGAIRRACLHATRSLIAQVNPPEVYWCTLDANLPEKALDKYLEIGRVFESLGYQVRQGDPYHGRHIWYAELLNQPGFPYNRVGE